MPRQPNPIREDASAELRELASAMRGLKEEHGLSFATLAQRVHYSTASLSNAVSGKRLPTWDVAWAFIRGCDDRADEAVWRSRWAAAEEGELRRPPAEDGGTAAEAAVRRQAAGAPRPRRSVAELVREEVARQQQSTSWRPSEADAVSTALALCTTAYDFRVLLRELMASEGLDPDEVRANARAQGLGLTRTAVLGILEGDDVPDAEPLHAFLLGCGVGPTGVGAWHSTATRIKISQARVGESADDGPGHSRRVVTSWRRFRGQLNLDTAIGMVCTVALTLLQLIAVAKHGI
ncbi:helix-turn-helix domain-containing protein [Streptomyces globosus]|uniref:helix-turn-helix domain-containing protein n=1 Tax=Streptomyces globosus TaxID=68209 RepID=UPI0031DE0A80